MNSAEEIAKYSDNNSHYRSPTLARRAGTELHDPQEKPKKDKKWSLGGFFRRRKKEVETESSTEEDAPPKRGFLQRRKQRKEDKRKKRANKSLGHFDHIVVTPVHQANNYVVNGNKDDESGGIFSDPTAGFPSYNSGSITKRVGSTDRISSRESLNKNRQDLNLSRGSLGSVSQDSTGKKSRREKAKARAEALRDRMKNESSSDEGSQRSTASSITRFKSDDSLSKKEGTARKSRSARTERHNRRLTKEDEHVLNKEAEMEKQRSSKSDVDNQQTRVQVNRWVVVDEMPKSPPIKPYIKPVLNYSPSVPLPQKSYSGISTIPPSHNMIHRTTSNLSDGTRNYFNASHKPTNIYNNVMRHPSDPMRSIPRNYHNNYHEKQDFKPEQRSFSYDCNINHSPTPGNEEQVLHVHFPIGKPVPKQRNPNLINNTQNLLRMTPPPPPPRDPQRRMFTNSQYENTRPMSYAFENGNQPRHVPVPVHQATIDRSSSIRSYNMPPSTQSNINRAHSFGWQPNYRSTSEDHIAQANVYNQHPVVIRPASATPDAPQQRFIRRHPITDQYKYFAEKTPRSRKPIHIAAPPTPEQTYLSDSQVVTRNYQGSRHPVHAASEFWKQKDAEEINRRKSQVLDLKDKTQKPLVNKKPEEKEVKKNFAVLSIPVKTTTDSLSSLSGNSDNSPLNTKPFFEQNAEPIRPLSMVLEKAEAQDNSEVNKQKKEAPEPPIRRYSRQSSASSTENNWGNEEEAEKKKRRSTNLEDALDELEAIYKSLRLGDEDLLDRAERRDVPPAVTQKLLTKMPDTYVNWGTPGTQSDSGFNYDFDCIDGLRKKRNLRKSLIPDKLNDDMAYRRLNKERPPPLDPNVAVSQVSYLLASPVLGAPPVDENDNESIKTANEPDITLDDVVYRNYKHTNNSLRVAEPQPFGIPIGPITTASNSDYLHAVPEDNIRPRFIPRKSPDIVKDDLAYRSLRKDSPGFAAEDYINNNNTKIEKDLKKRRAVRSISANIYSMMHKDSLRATESENEFDKAQSLTDIADAMEIARQILKDRQDVIYRKSASSDTETKALKSNMNCSNIPTSTETLTESKSNLLNDLVKDQKNQKPPICPSSKPPTKESTPNRFSPAPEEECLLDNNHLSDLLTALAIEARETSEKLGNDLKLLDEEQSRKASPRISQSTTPAREEAKSPVVIKTLDEKLSDIDAVSEHAKLCEKLLGAVVESTKLISHSVPPNNDLEEVSDMSDQKIFKSIANVIVTRNADVPTTDARSEQCSDSEHDYENIHKDDEDEEVTCTSPFIENKTKLLADFEELKKDLFSDDVNEELDNLSKDDDIKDITDFQCSATTPVDDDETFEKLQDSCSEGGEVCSDVVCLASNPSTEFDQSNEIFTPPEAFITSFDSHFNDIQNYIPLPSRTRTRDDSEHSSGFHTESRGSSSADSSLNPVLDFNAIQNFPEVEIELLCDTLHQIVNKDFAPKLDNSIFSSNDTTDSKSTDGDEPHFVSKTNSFHLANNLILESKSNQDKELLSQNLTSNSFDEPDNVSCFGINKIAEDICFASNSNVTEQLVSKTVSSEIDEVKIFSAQEMSVSSNIGFDDLSNLKFSNNFESNLAQTNDQLRSPNGNEEICDTLHQIVDKGFAPKLENSLLSSNDTTDSNSTDGDEPHFVSKTNNFHLANSLILEDKSNQDKELLSQNLASKSVDEPDDISCFGIHKVASNSNVTEFVSKISSEIDEVKIFSAQEMSVSSNIGFDDDLSNSCESTLALTNDKLPIPNSDLEESDLNTGDLNTNQREITKPDSVSKLSSSLHDASPSSSSCLLPYNCKSLEDARSHTSCEDEPEKRLDSNPAQWYRDPATLALACSYTLAFAHQLAIVDIVTLLGFILAIVTVVAAFVL